MIKINLIPEDELVNPLWWLPDALVAFAVLICSFLAVQYFLGQTIDKITELKIENESVQLAINDLKPRVSRYEEIKKKKEDLILKLTGLKSVTSSKVKKYRPVILLEHLQTLKPDGLWFDRVEMLSTKPPQAQQNTASKTGENKPADVKPNQALAENDVLLVGRAFDNLIVAEFMSALKSTRAQEVDPNDLRTQVYFNEVILEATEMGLQSVPQMNASSTDSSVSFDQNVEVSLLAVQMQFVKFTMKLKFSEREVETVPGPISFKSRNMEDKTKL